MYLCMCVRVSVFVCTYPPKVLPVGVSGNAVSCVDFAHQGTEASSFGDVLPAAHADHLHHVAHRQKLFTQKLACVFEVNDFVIEAIKTHL